MTRFLQADRSCTSLTYAPVPGGIPLFIEPVGSGNGNPACNGQTNLGPFRTTFTNNVWPLMPPGLCLSVIDSNAAHHLSLLLAEHAFQRFPRDARRARVIINVDAHKDWGGTVTPGGLRCSNWGAYAVRAVNDDQGVPIFAQPFADAYVSVGTKGFGAVWKGSEAQFRTGLGAGGAVRFVSQTAADQVAELLNLLALRVGAANAWQGLDVYISVDRDVAERSFTDYGDGAYPPDDVRAFVTDYMRALEGARTNAFAVRFAGFDLCGLPTTSGYSSAADRNASAAIRYGYAWADLQALAASIHTSPAPAHEEIEAMR